MSEQSTPKFWMTGAAPLEAALAAACRYIAQTESHGRALAGEAQNSRRLASAWHKEADRSAAEARKAEEATLKLATVLGKVTEGWTVDQWMLYTDLSVGEIADAQGWIARAGWAAGADTEAQS